MFSHDWDTDQYESGMVYYGNKLQDRMYEWVYRQ